MSRVGGAGRAAGDVDAVGGKTVQESFTAVSAHGQTDDMSRLFIGLGLVDAHAVAEGFGYLFGEISAKLREACEGFHESGGACLCGFTEACDADHVFRAATQTVFLSAAENDGGKGFCFQNFFADEKCADTLGTADLMRAYADGVCVGQRALRGFEESLNGVTMHDHVGGDGFRGFGDGGDIVDRARFVIDEHGGDENGVLVKRRAVCVHVPDAARRGNIDGAVAEGFKVARGLDHGGVLGFAHDEFFALIAGLRRHDTDEGKVVRLRARSREDELVALGTESRLGRTERGEELILRLGDGFFGKKSHFVQGGGIAVGARHDFRHFFDRFTAEGGGGAVVEVNFFGHIRLRFSVA